MNLKVIVEKLETLYEYDKDFFHYNDIAKDLWSDILYDTKKKFNIYFDTENDYSMKAQRVITIPQNKWKPTECKFKCELFEAGGDWEVPVYYFRIQIISGYCNIDDESRNSLTKSYFVFIPGKEEGNSHLIKHDDKWGAPNNNDYVNNIDPKPNEKECWDSLEKYLKNSVNKEINIVRNNNNN